MNWDMEIRSDWMVYRGSNNRLNEQGRKRNNANRLFDSQNNDRGGYNVGNLYYYAGSKLSIEWTNQHSCNAPNSHCELIIQYMCDDLLRDGLTTKTIPINQEQCANNDCNTDRSYGMHEDYDNYLKCQTTQRNLGLFVADQKLNSQKATSTRQNPGGTRRGYECPEERDYYPYWRSSPWKDIVVMTNDPRRCDFYKSESQNVKSKWECVLPELVMAVNKRQLLLPTTKSECEAFCYPSGHRDCVNGEWREMPSHGLPPPDCRETELSRDNHLGNGVDGHPNLYNWTVPDIEGKSCVMRIRYNISTDDYNPWNTDSSLNAERNQPSKVDFSGRYEFSTQTEAEERGYVFENNPLVKLFSDPELDFDLQLAINTAQFGRVFQDRSHAFQIRRRPEELQGSVIHNLNVRGKRGNIVQVYPAVEYDFVPNDLEVAEGDYIHFQWTGSNTNPPNNEGQGRAGTDRSNVVLLNAQVYPEGSGSQYGPGQMHGHYGTNYPSHIDNTTLLGLGPEDLENLAFLYSNQFGGDMSELDDAGTYFDLTPKKVTIAGTYNYMSTRNNNFSNRDHKGRILAYDYLVTLAAIGWSGGNVSLSDGSATAVVPQGVFDRLQKIRLESWSPLKGDKEIRSRGREISVGDSYVSNFLVVHPVERLAVNGRTFSVQMAVDCSVCTVAMYRSDPSTFSFWTRVNADVANGKAHFEAVEGGVYVARSESKIGVYVGAAVVCVAILLVLVGTIIYFKKHPEKFRQIQKAAKYAERSTKDKV
ncbi:protein DD3-3-like isoform X2 [Liolophura sinensis]|uniref:protein DD3-3-like isoform X2 n=1 Tax=Liolophura sinensis TaxID=3198878 RepID=UPI003158B948